MLNALRRNPANTHLGLMLALTFTTGIVDAVGYLGLDRVFTGNMTGNVVRSEEHTSELQSQSHISYAVFWKRAR